MSTLAAIRPDDWNLPLFVHVLGAMVLVGMLALAFSYLVPAWRAGSARALSLGFRTLLYGALPSFIVMRGAADWIAIKQDVTGADAPAWVTIGYLTTDAGALLLVVALVASGVASRRARLAGADGGTTGVRVATAMVSLLLVAYLVAIWAMTTKPG